MGPSGVVIEMLAAAGDVGVQWMVDLCNIVVKEGKVPDDWSTSWIVSVYKGKGDAMDCGSYRGIKLLEHAMKVFERVIETRIRKAVKIDDMQFGFQSGKGTTDATFIVRQLQEKYMAAKKDLWLAFVDLEKAFDRVPRDILWWSLRELGVEESIVRVVKSMYVGSTTAVKLRNGVSERFEVKVGVHQGSVLSPLLFIIVLEALTRKCRRGLPYELLFADDLILMAESKELLLERLSLWKGNMEAKGLKVNVGKTKVMHCHAKKGVIQDSGKDPCGMCGKGVRGNSIQCVDCSKWIHKRCSGYKGVLREGLKYQCPRCSGQILNSVAPEEPIEINLGDEKIECVQKFCYLGDMLGAEGGVEAAVRNRVRCAWGKFHELAPILTRRGASLKLKGKFYRACVQSVLLYSSETWAMKVEDDNQLQRAERKWPDGCVGFHCGIELVQRI
jgi:hypothetical protein